MIATHAALFALTLFAAPPADGASCPTERSTVETLTDALRDASGEWYENAPLPYSNGWLDAPAALDGITQQDRLRWTRHDDEKCAAMLATAAAVVGGRERFGALLDRLDQKALARYRKPLARARSSFERDRLTAGDIHRVSEILYITYVGGNDGSSDGDISRMIRASGFARVATPGKTPRELLDAAKPGDVFPVNQYLEQPEFIGWHTVLAWKDAAGVARIYDSDKFDGPQVFSEKDASFAPNYIDWISPGERIPAEWKPGTLFRSER